MKVRGSRRDRCHARGVYADGSGSPFVHAFWHTDEDVEITGIVKSVKLVNPHPEMVVEVTERERHEVAVDDHEPGNGQRHPAGEAGTKETVPVGTRVKVKGHPSRKEGAKALAAGTITMPDGKEVCFGGGCGIQQG